MHAFKGLTDIEKGVSGGIEERAEMISVLAVNALPSEMREATALGALKMLKAKGFSDVMCSIAPDDKENAEFVRSLGLTVHPP